MSGFEPAWHRVRDGAEVLGAAVLGLGAVAASRMAARFERALATFVADKDPSVLGSTIQEFVMFVRRQRTVRVGVALRRLQHAVPTFLRADRPDTRSTTNSDSKPLVQQSSRPSAATRQSEIERQMEPNLPLARDAGESEVLDAQVVAMLVGLVRQLVASGALDEEEAAEMLDGVAGMDASDEGASPNLVAGVWPS